MRSHTTHPPTHPHPSDPTTNNCGYGIDRGTSMATPAVAAAALLVRQYLAEGRVPSGAPNATAVLPSPSAALVRAVLLGGAAPMSGLLPTAGGGGDGTPLDPPPSTRQGFGRAALAAVVPLPPTVATGHSLRVVDGRTVADGAVDALCVRATGGGPVVVTLVWTDRPPSPAAAAAVVNDLDLAVTPPPASGAVSLPSPLPGNGGRDAVNTVERVVLPRPVAGVVRITVTGRSIPYAPQPYALAVHGAVEGDLRAGGDACPAPPPAWTRPPPALTNSTRVSASFSLEGAAECALTNTTSGAATPAPLFDWIPCTSPVVVTGLVNGAFTLAVRASGGGDPLSAPIIVDASPPVAVITTATAPAAGTPRGAFFAFGVGAGDVSPGGVTFECRLDRGAGVGAADAPATAPTRVMGAPSLSTWRPCTSPQACGSLPNGVWTFGVRARDAAGNAQATPPTNHTWRVALPKHVDVTGGDAGGAVTHGRASFTFGVVNGGAAAAAAVDSFSCTLSAWNATAGNYTIVDPATPCTIPKTYDNLGGGGYLFSVALDGGDPALAAVAAVSVATAPPTATLTTSPDRYVAAASVSLQWTLSPDASGAVCALQGPGLDSSAWSACASPSTHASLPDGAYVFRVAAVTAAGVQGPPAEASFVVDTSPPPPPIVALRAGRASVACGGRGARLTVAVTGADAGGAIGSGVAAFLCRNLAAPPASPAGPLAAAGVTQAARRGGAVASVADAATSTSPGRTGSLAVAVRGARATASLPAAALGLTNDGGPSFVPCGSAFTVTAPSLPAAVTVQAVAVDAAGNASPVGSCAAMLERAPVLSTGAAVGVVIALAVGVVGVIAAIMCWRRRAAA